MSTTEPDHRRQVLRTDAVLDHPVLQAAIQRLGRREVKLTVAAVQERVRHGLLSPDPDAVAAATLQLLPSAPTSLQPVINATGVVLHTNLGRAPLSSAAREAVLLAAGNCALELDLSTGGRGLRGKDARQALLDRVPGAEDAHLVNNGAAALALIAMSAAAGREIVISRGELVEIGDGFRIPDLLTAAGARLREVGTTNRTNADDYRHAIGPETAFILKVHPSNFAVTGFVQAVPTGDLTALGVPVVVDIGSGLLAPHPCLAAEPDAATVLAAGAAVVTASGDKLLGGPQAGLLLGAPGVGSDLVHRARRHPLARAMRVDKLTLAALEATLRGPETPVETALRLRPEELRRRARALAEALSCCGIPAEAVETRSTVGGGGAPGVVLSSAALALPERYGALLRTGRPAVIGRTENGRCLLDLRTVACADEPALLRAVQCLPPQG